MAEIDTTRMQPDEVQRYLHGEMSETERDALDERLLGDDAMYYELADAENDLIDRYAAGKLPENEAARFEKVIGGRPSLRARVANARALQEQIEHEQPRTRSAAAADKNWFARLFHLRSPVAGVVMSLTLIAAAGLSIYFYIQAREARDELSRAKGGEMEQQIAEARRDIEQLRAQVENAATESDELVRSLDAVQRRNRNLEAELTRSGGAKLARKSDAPSIASLVLDDKDRDGNSPTTSVELGTRKLAVNIALPETTKADAVFVIGLNGAPFGQRVTSQAGRAGKRAVTVMVALDKLRPGENVIRVFNAAGQEVTKHSFKVEEQ